MSVESDSRIDVQFFSKNAGSWLVLDCHKISSVPEKINKTTGIKLTVDAKAAIPKIKFNCAKSWGLPCRESARYCS